MKILRSPIFMPVFKKKARFSHAIVENCTKKPRARRFLPALSGQIFVIVENLAESFLNSCVGDFFYSFSATAPRLFLPFSGLHFAAASYYYMQHIHPLPQHILRQNIVMHSLSGLMVEV